MKHDQITAERLQLWKKRCNENKATPQIMISVGIEGKTHGQLFCQITEDISIEQVRGLLSKALLSL